MSSTVTKVFRPTDEMCWRFAQATAEERGAMVLEAIGGTRTPEGWLVKPREEWYVQGEPHDEYWPLIPLDQTAAFGSDLTCIARAETALGFQQQNFVVDSDYGGWEASVYLPPERTDHGRSYSSGTWTEKGVASAEVKARIMLILTYAAADDGLIEPTTVKE